MVSRGEPSPGRSRSPAATDTAHGGPDVAATFQRELERGVRLAVAVRIAALGLIAVWTSLRLEPPTLYHYLWLIGLLAAVGSLQVPIARLRSRRRIVLQAATISLEMAILAFALVVPPPGTPPEWSMAMQFRLGNFAYVFVFITLTALTLSPFAAIWTAFSGIVAWIGAMLAALAEDGVYTVLDLGRFQTMDIATLQAVLLDPGYLSAVERFQEGLLALVLGAVVALACARARRLVRREIRASTERANLARYFSPDLVTGLAAGGRRRPGRRRGAKRRSCSPISSASPVSPSRCRPRRSSPSCASSTAEWPEPSSPTAARCTSSSATA